MVGCQVQQECKLSALLGHHVHSACIKQSEKQIWSGRVSLPLLSRAKYRIVPCSCHTQKRGSIPVCGLR
jgi:hypothetical protein